MNFSTVKLLFCTKKNPAKVFKEQKICKQIIGIMGLENKGYFQLKVYNFELDLIL